MSEQWFAAAVQSANSAALIAVLVIGAYSDVRSRRLPNWLTLGGAALGLILGLTLHGPAAAIDSALGWLLGVAFLFPLFALRGMGAGDVKLLGAVGALKGVSFVFVAAIYMALAGGALAVLVLAIRGELLHRARSLLSFCRFALFSLVVSRSLPDAAVLAFGANERGALGKSAGPRAGTTLPYGLAIAIGGLLALAVDH